MAPVLLDLPFRGRWITQNSPTRRVPSHGTDLFGTTYAIDFVAVDERGRSAPRTWRSVLATEAPKAFVGFGAPILAPVDGFIMAVHDGEPDHEARRSPLLQLGYAVTQPERVRAGAPAIAGNHVIIAAGENGPFVLLAHLRQGSVRARVSTWVKRGDPVGACGNSGNSTEPHVHVQVTDTMEWATARGLPLAFYRPGGDGTWVPAESEIVEAR